MQIVGMSDYEVCDFIRNTLGKDKVIKVASHRIQAAAWDERYLWNVGRGMVRVVNVRDGVPKYARKVNSGEVVQYLEGAWSIDVVPNVEFVKFLGKCKECIPGF